MLGHILRGRIITESTWSCGMELAAFRMRQRVVETRRLFQYYTSPLGLVFLLFEAC